MSTSASAPVLAMALGVVPEPLRQSLATQLPKHLPGGWGVREGAQTTDDLVDALRLAGPACDWTTLLVTPMLGGQRDLADTLAGCMRALPHLRLAVFGRRKPETAKLVQQLAGHGLTNVLLDNPAPRIEDLVRLVTEDFPRSAIADFLTDRTAVTVTAPDLLETAPASTPEPEPSPDPGRRVSAVVSRWRSWRPGRNEEDPEDDEASAPRRGLFGSGAPPVIAVRQIVAVGGLGGGRYTSGTAVYTAKALTTHGTVLLLDWDPRGGFVTWTDAPPPDACWEAVVPGDPDTGHAWDWPDHLWQAGDGWTILTARGRFPERALNLLDADLVTEMLRWAASRWDFVVVDVGSDWTDPRTWAVLDAAQAALLCAGPGDFDVQRATRWLEWTALKGWSVAERVAFVGRGDGKLWRKRGGAAWITAWDAQDANAVGEACARWVVERPATVRGRRA